jgi:gamma-glutamyl-gamma-aminobutyrate hydrolase PuuD
VKPAGGRVGLTYSYPEKAEPYAEALRLVGLEPVLLAPGDAASIEGLDGLLISGGCDLNPKLYGQTPEPKTDQPDDRRDELESRLLSGALERDLPVLAICRGMQLFNVHHGGSLDQHRDGHEARSQDPSVPAHLVTVAPETELASIVGDGSHPVNSRHHQTVARVGNGLIVSARSDDGVIEGLERPDKRFAVAVQWHPEDQASSDEAQRKLFQAFAQAVAAAHRK